MFGAIYFLLNWWCAGLGVPAGIFAPKMICGAALGRMVGELAYPYFQAVRLPIYENIKLK
jgi:chloride channel 6